MVRVRACALNRLDAWVVKGVPAYKITPPHAPGTDLAGVVEVVGAGVTSVKAGDAVVAYPIQACGTCDQCRAGRENLCAVKTVVGAGPRWGGYAELVLLPAADLLPKPANLPFEEAAAIPVTFLTAWNMLVNQAAVKAGRTVLVVAAGSGVGTAATAIALHLGARVLGTASTEAKRARVKAAGVEAVFNHREEDFWKRVRDATGGRGVDVVVEHVGPASFKGSLQSLAPGGVLVTCGATTGPEAALDLRYVFSRQLAVKGAYIGGKGELAALLDLFQKGALKPVVDAVYPASRAAEALGRLLAGESFGKIVLRHEGA